MRTLTFLLRRLGALASLRAVGQTLGLALVCASVGLATTARASAFDPAPGRGSLSTPLDARGQVRILARHQPLVVDGVRVLGGGVYELSDASGRSLWRHERPLSLDLGPQPWRLSAPEALVAAQRALGAAAGEAGLDPRLARRVVLPYGAGLPAWRVHLPPVLGLASNPVVWVDARTGAVLRRENLVWTERRAQVYPGNPVSTPDLVEVELAGLDSAAAGSFLEGPLVRSFNCPDRGEMFDVVFLGARARVHLCSEVHVAAADPQGDFVYPGDQPNDAEDLFAEVHMFHHVGAVYDFFQGLGFEELREKPLRAVVNFRIPNLLEAFSPEGELEPFDNAFFLPAHDLRDIIDRPEDSIVFGQGTAVDFAYDADVIYHEFSHAVVDTLTGLQMGALDRWGVSMAGGSLHEGYADYFAAALGGDPRVGEYAIQGFAPDEVAIRDITSDHRCPNDLIGEVHEDSLPWSGALWDLRAALTTELGLAAADVDQAVLQALGALPEDAGFEQAAAATLAAMEQLLGAAAAEQARVIFERRGVSDCARVVEASGRDVLLLPGMGSWAVSNMAPGFLQLALDVPREHGLVTVEFLLPETSEFLPGIGGGEAQPWVMIKTGEAPLEFSYDTSQGDLRAVPNAQRMVRAEDLDAGSSRWPHAMRAVLPFGPGATRLHVMLFNRGPGEVYLRDVQVTTAADPSRPWEEPDLGTVADLGTAEDLGTVADLGGAEPEDLGPVEGDLAGAADQGGADSGGAAIDPGAAAGGGGDAGDGCSCAAPAARGRAAGPLLVLLGLGLAALRRRDLRA